MELRPERGLLEHGQVKRSDLALGLPLLALAAWGVLVSLRPGSPPTSPEVAPPPLPPAAPATTSPAPTGPAPIGPASDAAPGTSHATTIVVLRWGAERIELVRAVDKPGLRWAAGGAGAARFVLEDAATGARLAEGPCAAPRLCPCERGQDHLRGDVMVRHQAVVRLKLPRLAARERLRIETPGPDGWEERASLLLEGRS
jgi:hypothetical protein